MQNGQTHENDNDNVELLHNSGLIDKTKISSEIRNRIQSVPHADLQKFVEVGRRLGNKSTLLNDVGLLETFL